MSDLECHTIAEHGCFDWHKGAPEVEEADYTMNFRFQ